MDPTNLSAASALAWGLAVASLVWIFLDFLTAPRPQTTPASSFERARRSRLRQENSLYRLFGAGIDKLAQRNARIDPARLEAIRHALRMNPQELPFTPEEYLAARQLESILAGVGGALFGMAFFGDILSTVLAGGLAAWGYQKLALGNIAKKAERRMLNLKRRLPFAIDLMALMMEAGASFQEAMTTVVRESQGHPLGEEFGQVLRDVSLGRTRQDALAALQARLQDDDVTEVVFAVNKGEELGTPLAQILRNQAEQMRLKRTQWAEKASGEAQVNIVFPGMVIMIACLIIVTAPFILGALAGEP